ncbi:uncharacterized protein PGTG_21583 [Puccinia graminis f. sp. tritici CRL 75-36-700-3]|uniref:Uncharacterized protein n=1 Tax=Puccinia graminis f. sp. tritici (strain CRL 75-36-700-3 / race SCCL) TaxID=418459 RepID=H6QRW8_PUCGT|nr:uncharacterized protein PGTG_21583 [Puccinia graminis f. sp. tritici CRL 75-36-700-3]EHS63452.1 hypothetical protein PGTG_21583 [Puccinia graminis f. sp. tritici CRL 75-36-700-3]
MPLSISSVGGVLVSIVRMGSTKGNLKSHRDGYTQKDKNDRGCPNREKAKQEGVKLPPSVAERRKMANGDGKQNFLQAQPQFVNQVLNQLIMIWQIRQALPWTRH